MNLLASPLTPSTVIPAWVELSADVRWPVEIRRGSPRSFRLFLGDQAVILESPRGAWGAEEQQFLHEKMPWLRRQFANQGHFRFERAKLRMNRTTTARLFGRAVPIVYEVGPKLWYRFDGETLHIVLTDRWMKRSAAQRERVVVAVMRKLGADYLTKRTRHLAALVEIGVGDIRVKGHRSKWGSCSWEGNINLNWHLMMLDRQVIDYVILHELMHRLQMNHSPKFWAQVAKWMPEYKAVIARLRRDEWVLGVYDERVATTV